MLKIYKIFPALLCISLFIGIISNIIVFDNLSLSYFVVALTILIFLILSFSKNFIDSFQKNTVNKIIFFALILIIIIQLLVFTYLPATIFHDPFRVTYQAEVLSYGNKTWNSSTYFWRYPNNVPITFLLSLWLKITHVFHLTTNTSIHILNIMILDGFILSSLKLCQKFIHNNHSTLFLLSFFLLSPFAYTYYLQVFYSDLLAIVILLAIFLGIKFWDTFNTYQKIEVSIGLTSITLIGQLVKPNLIVLIVALFFTAILYFYINRHELSRLKVPIIAILVGFILVIPAKTAIFESTNFQNNDIYEFPTAHWIWMGLNPETGGLYNHEDAKKTFSLPNKETRESYLKEAIPKRLKSLGIMGYFIHCISKDANLLNVGTLQKSYTGGFINAPDIYQKYQVTLSIIGSLIMRSYFIIFYLLTIITLIKTDFTRFSSSSWLAVITAVGYIAFHVLIWEVEPRYGQIIIPLLLLLNIESTPKIITEGFTFRFAAVLFLFATIVTAGIRHEKPLPMPIITGAQRSQLSSQYQGPLHTLEPHSTISQIIYLNHCSTYFSLSVPDKSDLDAFLVNTKSKKIYRLKKHHDNYRIKSDLPAGKYKIIITNNHSYPQLVNIIQTRDYQLSPHALFIRGYRYRYSSLIYKSIYEQPSHIR